MKEIPQNVSEAVRKLNPHLYRVGGVEAKVAKPNQRSEKQDSKLEGSASGMAFRVSLVVMARRTMDSHDNLRASLKPLADRIAETLGRDDSEIEWEYQQMKTEGNQGVMVRIEAL